MTEKLKPCPFCGGEAKLIDDDWSYVICTKCGIHPYHRISLKDAIEEWNNRPNPWHTGIPTEEGTYLVNDGLNDYAISYFDGEKFSSVYFPNKEVIRLWQKIEPFKETE